MKVLAASWIAAAAMLAGCQTVSETYDRIFQGAAGPGRKPAALVELKPAATLKILWQGSAGGAEKNVFFPEVSGSIVYAASAAGRVSGFEARSGKAVAQFDAGQRISGGVGAGAGLVLVGTPRGEVLAFDRNGKQAWKAQLGGQVLAPPAAQDGTVVARAGDGRIYGLDAASGKRKWTYQRSTPALSVRTHAGVVVHRGGVFAGFPGGHIVALSLPNGVVGWEAAVAVPRGTTELERVADIAGPPVVDGQRVCAVAFQGRVACFDITRGTILWSRDVSSLAGLAVDARYLYVTDDKNAVLALDKASGASIWRQDKLARRGVSAPLGFGRYAVVGDFEGYVHLLAREDGSFAARIATDGSAIVAPPVALDLSSFLVQTRNGGIYAITVQ
ncbi:MAG: outer membrane protein assembly factor BamB [Betaproteobacteria bacterium]|nr:outer membrane protein assembly factor BamB [Betaproteobacteria bacterium]